MSLPDSRDETAVFQVTPVRSAVVNSVQDWLVTAWKALCGQDVHVEEEFAAETLNSYWNLSGNGTESAVDDRANGATGAWEVNLNASIGRFYWPDNGVGGVGAGDFRCFQRVRVPTKGNSGARFGLWSTGTSDRDLFFYYDSGSANWKVQVGAASTTTSVAVSTSYQNLLIKREAGTVFFHINGTQVHSVSSAGNLGTAATYVIAEGTVTHAGASFRVDKIKFWGAVA